MDYAFTDEMVRRDRESLTEQAVKYVLNFHGEFPPLVAAKDALAQGHDLNVAEIRMVLNAMRSDTRVRLVYTPPAGSNVIEFPQRGRFGDPFDDDEPRSRRVRINVTREPVWRLHRRFRINMPFVMSRAARSMVIHLVSKNTECHYHPIGSHNHGEKVWGEPQWEFRIKTECTSDLARANLRLLTDGQANQLIDRELMRWCKWCPKLRDARK